MICGWVALWNLHSYTKYIHISIYRYCTLSTLVTRGLYRGNTCWLSFQQKGAGLISGCSGLSHFSRTSQVFHVSVNPFRKHRAWGILSALASEPIQSSGYGWRTGTSIQSRSRVATHLKNHEMNKRNNWSRSGSLLRREFFSVVLLYSTALLVKVIPHNAGNDTQSWNGDVSLFHVRISLYNDIMYQCDIQSRQWRVLWASWRFQFTSCQVGFWNLDRSSHRAW